MTDTPDQPTTQPTPTSGTGTDQTARLKAELAAVRAQRDDLARRLAAATGEDRTGPGVGRLALPGVGSASPSVVIDLPLDVQSTSERGLPWAFADEARDQTLLRPGAYVLAGDEDDPVLVRVVEVDGDDRVHVALVGGGPFIPADLNFESDEAGVVLAPIPATGAPAVGAEVLAGTAVAWSWTRVQAVEAGWLLLELTGPPLAPDGFVHTTLVADRCAAPARRPGPRLNHCEDEIVHPQALAHTLYELRYEPPTAALATQLVGRAGRAPEGGLAAHTGALRLMRAR